MKDTDLSQMQHYEITQKSTTISTDPSLLNIDIVHDYLCNHSYWAKNRSIDTVRNSIKNSLCFGVYKHNAQIGFARVITDYSVFAFILDVFILEHHQGQGIGKLLIQAIMAHPDLQGKLLWSLATKDAHDLYRKYGFNELPDPTLWMQFDKRNS